MSNNSKRIWIKENRINAEGSLLLMLGVFGIYSNWYVLVPLWVAFFIISKKMWFYHFKIRHFIIILILNIMTVPLGFITDFMDKNGEVKMYICLAWIAVMMIYIIYLSREISVEIKAEFGNKNNFR